MIDRDQLMIIAAIVESHVRRDVGDAVPISVIGTESLPHTVDSTESVG